MKSTLARSSRNARFGTRTNARSRHHSPHHNDERTTATGSHGSGFGCAIVAAVLLISGIWNFLEGLAALIKGKFYILPPYYAYNASVGGRGWSHLMLGIVLITAGACLLAGLVWIQLVRAVLAAASSLAARTRRSGRSPLTWWAIWALLSRRR